MNTTSTLTAFAGSRLIASGDVRTMLVGTKAHIDAGEQEPILIFDDQTGAQIDFDFRGTAEDVVGRLAEHPAFAPGFASAQPRTGPGRPKLGVVCREVSLLPRHWEWLEAQSGGLSAALRRLVDEARKRQPAQVDEKRARDATSRFMWSMAGNLPGFEEASRALFSGEYQRFKELVEAWPTDIRAYLQRLLGHGKGGGL